MGVLRLDGRELARIRLWRKLLETGDYATIDEMAAAEKINSSYVSRMLRLTLLAPDIVETVLGRRQQAEMTLAVLMRPFPVGWGKQRERVGTKSTCWKSQVRIRA